MAGAPRFQAVSPLAVTAVTTYGPEALSPITAPLAPVVVEPRRDRDSRVTVRRQKPPSGAWGTAAVAASITFAALCLSVGAALVFIYR